MSEPDETPRAEAAERIWHVLASHRGAENAITAAEIASRTRIGDAAGTQVRAVISEALEYFPKTVAAFNRGFFVVVTAEEAEHCVASLMSRLRKMGRRVAIVRRKLAAAGFTREGRKYFPPPPKDGLF